MKHVAVCIPFARDYIYTDFFMSWTRMFLYARGKYDLSLVTIIGPYIDDNRERLIASAIGIDPDYILFLDDDQIYPPNTPQILMNHIESGKLIVGGVTAMKETCEPMLWSCNDESHEIELWSGFKGNTGLTKVDGLGFGGVMIHPNVFFKMERPYFRGDNATKWHRRGEDIEFYLKCKKLDIDVWADLDLQFGHITTRAVQIGDTPRQKTPEKTD